MGVSVFQGWFSFAGRRNRKSYFLFNLLLLVVFAALVGLVFASAPTLEEFDVAVVVDEDQVTVEGEVTQEGGEMQAPVALFALCVVAVMVFCHAVVSAQRFRDFGWTGWGVLLFLLPVVNIVAAIVLLVMPGTAGANRYGPDPLR